MANEPSQGQHDQGKGGQQDQGKSGQQEHGKGGQQEQGKGGQQEQGSMLQSNRGYAEMDALSTRLNSVLRLGAIRARAPGYPELGAFPDPRRECLAGTGCLMS